MTACYACNEPSTSSEHVPPRVLFPELKDAQGEVQALQAQVLAPPVDEDVVAYGRLVQRDGDAFWADVDVAGQSSARVVARGTVLYRIVT